MFNSTPRPLALLVPFIITVPAAAQTPPMQEVSVVGKAKPVLNLIDRKVYKVAAGIFALSGTAADVLNTIPSVSVDADGSLSLRGDSRLVILVDGKPSAQLSGAGLGEALLQFSANDIEAVEVMTTPPAEYRAEGTGGVINIITKKSRKPGESGTLLANIGNQRRYVLGASASYNAEQWKLSGGLGLRQDDRERRIRSSLEALGAGANAASSEERLEHARRLIPTVKGGIDYQLDDARSVALDINFRQRGGDRSSDQRNTNAAGTSIRHSDGYEWSMSGEQRLSFRQELAGKDETLDVSVHRSTDVERERYAYLKTAAGLVPVQSREHLYQMHDFLTRDIGADYRKVLGEARLLKLGANLQVDSNGYANAGDNVDPVSGQPVPDPGQNNQFHYRQVVQALYLSYAQPLTLWSLSTGLRYERTSATGDQLTTAASNRRQYAGFYPSVHLERPWGQGSSIAFGYARRLSRPDPDDLNPYLDQRDLHNPRAGNPGLLPQETDALEASYRVEADKSSYGLTAYLRRNRNSVTDLNVLLGADVLLSTKTNLPHSQAGGLEFQTDAALAPDWSYRFNGNLFRNQIDATAFGASGLKSTSGLNLKASLDYHPSKTDTAQVSFTRTDKRLTPQGYIRPIHLVNLGYRHQLQPDLSLVMTVSDVFNGQRQQRFLETALLRQSSLREQSGRVIYAGLVVQFGVQKKAKGNGFDYEQ
jgi:outer membrane receptor protein involved in Fe transport